MLVNRTNCNTVNRNCANQNRMNQMRSGQDCANQRCAEAPCANQNRMSQMRSGQDCANQRCAEAPCANQNRMNQMRSGQMHGSHSRDTMESCRPDTCITIPTGDRRQLMAFINEVSFAVYETLLYLDTHPEDQDALQYFNTHNRLRNRALKAYEESFGPLVIAVADESCSHSWEWVNQPWPWEGGAC